MEWEAKTGGRRTAGVWEGLNTSNRTHKCSHCDYITANMNDLSKHISIQHSGAKPYSCTYCPYRTTRNNLLKEHINTHTGERPFACPYCSYSSSHRNILKRHIRTHTGERPYTCTLCPYRAASKTNLNSHLFMHKKKESALEKQTQWNRTWLKVLSQNKHTNTDWWWPVQYSSVFPIRHSSS